MNLLYMDSIEIIFVILKLMYLILKINPRNNDLNAFLINNYINYYE